ncbi:hypothetical protein [Lacipirellula sp.]|uniref:hypothetical protein n=1 Tax=Lacipirellula sp. TaxID=2691419 RepID=UPI003D1460B8
MTIEQRLDVLARCGLHLKEEFSVADLVDAWGREALDEADWDLALLCLGSAQEEPPWTPYSENVWHFDTECIEGDGSYVRIARRMADMTRGSLPLADVQDHVDVDEETAWLSFTCQGKPVRIDCKVQDDWVDPGLFGYFVMLLGRCDPTKVYFYYDLGGQDCILGCVAVSEYRELQKVLPAVQELS